MFWQQSLILLGLLAAAGSTAPAPAPSPSPPPSSGLDPFKLNKPFEFYRADTRSHQEIKKSGGFKSIGTSLGYTKEELNLSLWDHSKEAVEGFKNANDDGWISTSSDFGVCQKWIEEKLESGTIYKIASYKNLIDVNDSLKHFSPLPEEQEYTAIGGIPWEQVMGWFDQFTIQGRNTITDAVYTENTEYDSAKYTEQPHGGAQPQLAGFPAGHDAWNQEPWIKFTEEACPAGSSKSGEQGPSRQSGSTKTKTPSQACTAALKAKGRCKCTQAMKLAGKCGAKDATTACTTATKKASKCDDTCPHVPIKTNKEYAAEYMRLLTEKKPRKKTGTVLKGPKAAKPVAGTEN